MLLIKPDSVEKWNGPYLRDEKNLQNPWGNPYIYKYPFGEVDGYILYSFGPDEKEGTEDDIIFKSFERTEKE